MSELLANEQLRIEERFEAEEAARRQWHETRSIPDYQRFMDAREAIRMSAVEDLRKAVALIQRLQRDAQR